MMIGARRRDYGTVTRHADATLQVRMGRDRTSIIATHRQDHNHDLPVDGEHRLPVTGQLATHWFGLDANPDSESGPFSSYRSTHGRMYRNLISSSTATSSCSPIHGIHPMELKCRALWEFISSPLLHVVAPKTHPTSIHPLWSALDDERHCARAIIRVGLNGVWEFGCGTPPLFFSIALSPSRIVHMQPCDIFQYSCRALRAAQ
jgi:hypothetical protein